MTPSNEPDPIARRAREVFEAASADLDGATAGRLRLARRSALSARTPPLRGWLAPLAGAVAVALAAWLAWPRAQAPAPVHAPIATVPTVPTAPIAPPPVEVEAPMEEAIDEEPLADADADLATVDDEDAELYAWLADAPVAPDTEGDAL